MLNCKVKYKVVSEEKIIGIVLDKGSSEKFVSKEDFFKLREKEFLNAKLTADGKVLATQGKIPTISYSDYTKQSVSSTSGSEVMLYHGSNHIVTKPVFGQGKVNNDYGQGFYCTRNKDLAYEWSCNGRYAGFVNTYSLDYECLNVLNLGHTSYKDIMTWLAILLSNRTFELDSAVLQRRVSDLKSMYLPKDYRSYDVIRGYRADDSYFSYVRDFILGVLSYEGLSSAMFFGKLGIQEVLISKKAFDLLTFIKAEKSVPKYIQRYRNKDTKARKDYFSFKDSGSLFLTDILRGGY